MRKFAFVLMLFALFAAPFSEVQAQTNVTIETTVTTETTELSFSGSGTPQWARDLRRFEIIAFGTYPFSFFFTTFFYDLVRWYNANGMDFSDEGRRYAPWPFRTAGGVEMSNRDYQRVMLIAAGVSITFALIDYFIVRGKRNREQRRMENIPSSTYEIETLPYGDAEPEN